MTNWWKVGFFCAMTAAVVVAAIGAYMVLDQAVTIDYMRVGYKDTEKDLAAMSTLVDHRYVGMTKTEMLPLLQRAYAGELVKDEGSTVLAGQFTFQFDEAGKFVRILHPQ
jgi:hypothetical protein